MRCVLPKSRIAGRNHELVFISGTRKTVGDRRRFCKTEKLFLMRNNNLEKTKDMKMYWECWIDEKKKTNIMK